MSNRSTPSADVIRSPYDGSVVGHAPLAGSREVDDAIETAARTFETTRRMPTHARVAVLDRAARLLEARSEEFARRMALEGGKPIRYARGEVARAVITFDLAASECRGFGGEVLPVDLEPRAEGRICLATRVPRGPIAAISPFNFPLNLIAHKLAPAVAVGASVVLKPPPQCPLTGFELASVLAEAGLPAGALGVVHCPPEIAQRIVEDERMRVVSFTGNDAVGWRLKSLAGKKQVLLELGGNAPCVVDETADLDLAMEKIVAGAWAHAGQVCIKVQRIYVHAASFDRFLEEFVRRTRELPCGDPLDERTVVGPLIEPRHVERVLAWIREAVEGGATLHCGGTAEGNVVSPAILTGTAPEMRVCREEVFGPVTVVERFETFDEALAACNASRFGLQAGVFTRDLGRALRAYRELDYGGVMINEVPTFRVDNFPYGGMKDSGFGREGVRYAMEEMTVPKVLVMGT
jgi:glyceraldehyde-3-phosphate dehydrogenase (NADP+)